MNLTQPVRYNSSDAPPLAGVNQRHLHLFSHRSNGALNRGARFLAFLAASVPTLLLAQTAAPPPANQEQESVITLDPFTVNTTTDNSSFLPTDASSATRIATSLRDMQMAVSVMTSAVLNDVMSRNLREAAYYEPGATGGQTNRTMFFNETNFRNVVSYYPFTDGSTLLESWAYDEASDIDRIEVIRGPSGVVFGSGNFGGLNNKISKQPLFSSQHEAEITVGDNGFMKDAIDLTGPIPHTGNKLAYRIIATYTGGPTSDKLDDRLYQDFIHASLSWRPSPDTVFTVNLKTRLLNTQTNGMGDVLQGSSISTLYRFDTTHIDPVAPFPYLTHYSGTMAYFTLEHNVGDWLSLRTLGAVTRENIIYRSFSCPYPSGGYNPQLDMTGSSVALPAGMLNALFRDTNAPGAQDGIDQDILLKFAAHGLDTKTLVTFNVRGLNPHDQIGGAAQDYRQFGYLSFNYINGPIGIPAGYNPVPAAGPNSVPAYAWTFMHTKPSLTASVQEFWSAWENKLNLSGGYSHNVQHGSEEDLSLTSFTHVTDDFSANVIRYGISVRPISWASIYAEYNQGFNPPSPRVDPNSHQVYGPATSRDREGGVRLFFLKDRLVFTADIYRTDLGGILAASPNTTVSLYTQTGTSTDNGWETTLQGEITPQWSITASVNTGDYVNAPTSTTPTSTAAYYLHNSQSTREYGSLYTSYDIRSGPFKNVTVGLGEWYKLRYVDGYYIDSVSHALTERDFPNAVIWMATLDYHCAPFTFRIHATNLFNKFYYVTESSNIWDRGDGRRISFETDYRF